MPNFETKHSQPLLVGHHIPEGMSSFSPNSLSSVQKLITPFLDFFFFQENEQERLE